MHNNDMTYSERITTEIRVQMVRANIDRATLAVNADIPYDTLGRRLRGESPFDIDELAAVAKALGTTPAAILTTVDQNTPKD